MKGNLIFIFFGFSFLLHISGFLAFSFQIQAKKNPQVYGWLNLFSQEELFFQASRVKFPDSVDLSADSIRRQVFGLPQVNANDCQVLDNQSAALAKGVPQVLDFLNKSSC